MVEKIRELCEKKGISISKLERETGLGNGIIGKWEKFGREPKFVHIKAIADYFGVPVSAITGEEQKESPPHGGELSKEVMEIIELYDKASPELRAAALAVLKSAEAVQTIPDAGEGDA